ncbi:MAG: tetratricopeptide repeat protein [Anaerolineae bacterium]|nr:tetratricopeptide repeat protein [Anaerolineae bacterium]
MDLKGTLANLFRPALRPHERALENKLDAAWKAQIAENYDAALELLERALEVARSAPDQAAEVVALLHKAEIYTAQARYDAADELLRALLTGARGDTQRSYIHSGIGMLAQARGDMAGARSAFEQAVNLARRAVSSAAEGRALGLLAGTYLHEGNASYAAHLLNEALPRLAAAGDNELNSLLTGLLGLAMIQNGQVSDGQHALERALRLAEQAGYRIYERRWGQVLGDRALDEGRYPEAYSYYSHVLRLFAPDAASAEYVGVVAQISKASLSLHKPDEALAHAQSAFMTAKRLNDPALLCRAEGALGAALRAVGRSEEAIPHLQAAAEGDAHMLRSLAAAQVDTGDSPGAIATYQRAIQEARAADKPLELAQARRDLGLVYLAGKDYPAAISEWTAALAVYDELHAYAQVARLHCDIGSARQQLGQRARAVKDFEQALMVLNSLDTSDQHTRGLVLSNAANAYTEQGDVESADAFFTEAIVIAERLGDAVAESTRNGNYGWFLLLVGRPRRAITTLERALAISQPNRLTLQTAIQLDNLGLVYDSLGDIAVALEKHRQALALVDEPGGDPLRAGQIKVNLAGTLVAARAFAEAETLLADGLAAGRAGKSAELIISALVGQARLWMAQEEPAGAEDALTEAIALARRIDHRRLLAEALSARSQQQAALDRPDDSAAVWEEAQRLYAMLHMPQGKLQPVWLTRSDATRSATRT